MTRRADITVTEDGVTPQPGVFITVKAAGGALAAITTDGGAAIAGSTVLSGADGSFSYNAPNGTYTEEYRLSSGGAVRKIVAVTLDNFSNAAQIANLGGGTVQDAIPVKGPTVPAVGSMAVKLKYDFDSKLIGQAGIWVNTQKWTLGLSDTIGLGDGTTNGPSGLLFLRLEQAGSAADAVTLMNVCNITAGNCSGFTINNVCTTAPGLANVKLVVGEDDWEPSVGTTINSGSVLHAYNAFTTQCPVAQLVSGVAGGNFLNGTVYYKISAAAIAAGAGETMGSLINGSSATFSQAMIIHNQNQRSRFSTGTANFDIFADALNLRFILAGVLAFRNTGDTATMVGVTPTGEVAIGQFASPFVGFKLDVATDNNTEGTGAAQFKSANGTAAAQIYNTAGTSGNAANCALRLRANSINSRSINAGGTINAAGADYAEYERRGENCGAFVKGQIVGFSADGSLTDRFADAISFGIKSTNPNLVGGDDWASFEAPVEPVLIPLPYDGPSDPGPTWPIAEFSEGYVEARANLRRILDEWKVAEDAGDAEQAMGLRVALEVAQDEVSRFMSDQNDAQTALVAQWQADRLAYEQAVLDYKAACAAAEIEFYNTTHAEWCAEMAAHNTEVERERAWMERIAYCGKVPVNLKGALPGQHIVAIDDGRGGIAPAALDDAAISFEQFRLSLGRVRRVLSDGRAEVVVRA